MWIRHLEAIQHIVKRNFLVLVVFSLLLQRRFDLRGYDLRRMKGICSNVWSQRNGKGALAKRMKQLTLSRLFILICALTLDLPRPIQ